MLGIEHGIIVVAVSILGALLGIVVVISIIQRRHAPGHTLAWLLLVILLPYAGVPLYLIFGGRKQRRMAARKPSLAGDGASEAILPGNEMERILRLGGAPCARNGNRLGVLATGEEAYETMLRIVEQARHTLWMTTYSLASDEVGTALLQAMARKAKGGVQVRLLLDAVGSLSLGRAELAPLEAAGGRTAFFMPISRILGLGRPDLRIHRKILVADGARAVVGGRNVGAEYLGPVPHPDRWTDLSVLMEGPAVSDVAGVFAQDWLFAAEEELPPAAEAPAGFDREALGSMTEKAAIVAKLKESFAHSTKAFAGLSDADCAKAIKMFGRDSTVEQMLMLMANHQHEHLGQMIAYARSNGIVPPWSK